MKHCPYETNYIYGTVRIHNIGLGYKVTSQLAESQLAESQLAECLYVGVRNRVRARDRG